MEKAKAKGIIASVITGLTTLATDFYNRLFKKRKTEQSVEVKEDTSIEEKKEETSGYEGTTLSEDSRIDWLATMYNDDNVPAEYKSAIEILARAPYDERLPAYYRRRLTSLTRTIQLHEEKQEHRMSLREFIVSSAQYQETLRKANRYADSIRNRIKKQDYTCVISSIELGRVEFLDGVGVVGVITVTFNLLNRHNNNVIEEFKKDFDFVIAMTKEEYAKYY